jgi:hypothetical protein
LFEVAGDIRRNPSRLILSSAASLLIAVLALPQRKKPQQISCWGQLG